MREIKDIAAQAIGMLPERPARLNKINEAGESGTRPFPVDLASPARSNAWVKITDWNVKEERLADLNSTRRVRITQDLLIAPFF